MLATTPAGVTQLTVTVELLRAALEDDQPVDQARSTAGDLTLEEVADQVHRAPSTVRGWLNAGLVAGAYKLRGRDWRVPPSALAMFLRQQDAEGGPVPAPPKPARLDAWRDLRPPGTAHRTRNPSPRSAIA
jgi:hypothetical protein